MVLRLSLVFPLIAIAAPGALLSHIKYSWDKMSGNILALIVSAFVLSFIISLFTGLPVLVLGSVFGGGTVNFTVAVVAGALDLGAGFLNSLFLVLFASYIYKMTK